MSPDNKAKSEAKSHAPAGAAAVLVLAVKHGFGVFARILYLLCLKHVTHRRSGRALRKVRVAVNIQSDRADPLHPVTGIRQHRLLRWHAIAHGRLLARTDRHLAQIVGYRDFAAEYRHYGRAIVTHIDFPVGAPNPDRGGRRRDDQFALLADQARGRAQQAHRELLGLRPHSTAGQLQTGATVSVTRLLDLKTAELVQSHLGLVFDQQCHLAALPGANRVACLEWLLGQLPMRQTPVVWSRTSTLPCTMITSASLARAHLDRRYQGEPGTHLCCVGKPKRMFHCNTPLNGWPLCDPDARCLPSRSSHANVNRA
jgi:hypothetical protein